MQAQVSLRLAGHLQALWQWDNAGQSAQLERTQPRPQRQLGLIPATVELSIDTTPAVGPAQACCSPKAGLTQQN